MPINIGSRFDRYEILSLLGAGGMGEVYLAWDTKLDRRVALKILPPLYTNDTERVRRFEKEAKAASALNHPNIITIYEVGHTEGAHFIATEYIEGQTLRRKMRKERLGIAEAIEITIQISRALDAAHSAGILHRDIKPENIMLRPDGYVKVLDFGLAKLTERRDKSGSGGDFSPLDIETDPGMVLGTATYMSPEQARAQRVDERSDIFSLGIVFYEMIAGRSPFHDQSAGDVMAAILQREPAPLSQHSPEVTPELDKVAQKILSKDRDARYQSAKELQADLNNLRQQPSEASPAPDQKAQRQRDGLADSDGIGNSNLETRIESAGRPTGEISPADNTSANIIFGEIKKHKRGVVISLLVLMLILGVIGIGIWKLINWRPEPVFKNAKFTRLVTPGRANDAVISPDGKYVAYVADDGGKRSLWVRQVTTTSNAIQIVPPSDHRFRSPTFSRDGNHIYFVQRRSDSPLGDLYRVPTLSGTPRKLISGVSSPVALSHDNKQVAYVREQASNSSLLIANADGTNERELACRTLPDSFSIEGPDWSPDGQTIACPVINFASGVNHNVVAIRIADRSERLLLEQHWPNVGRVVWTADGKGVLMAAREPSALGRQVWFISYSTDGSGKITRITNDLNDYRGVTASADGSTVAAVQINQISNLWIARAPDGDNARQITFGSGSNDGVQGLAWTPDGKIVYSSNANGKPDLWKLDINSGQPQQLTTDAATHNFPAVSADGRYIAFNSDRSGAGGSVNIWRMDADGGNPRQLTFGQLDLDPHFTPAGDWLVFSSIKSGKRTLWKVPVDGGEPSQLLDVNSEYPIISPDGKWLACSYRDEKVPGAAKFAVLSFAGGAPIIAFDIPTTPWRLVRWSPDSQALTYVAFSNGAANIYSQPIVGGVPKQLTDFRSNHIFGFEWSPDGRWLAMARGLESREIVLISNFR